MPFYRSFNLAKRYGDNDNFTHGTFRKLPEVEATQSPRGWSTSPAAASVVDSNSEIISRGQLNSQGMTTNQSTKIIGRLKESSVDGLEVVHSAQKQGVCDNDMWSGRVIYLAGTPTASLSSASSNFSKCSITSIDSHNPQLTTDTGAKRKRKSHPIEKEKGRLTRNEALGQNEMSSAERSKVMTPDREVTYFGPVYLTGSKTTDFASREESVQTEHGTKICLKAPSDRTMFAGDRQCDFEAEPVLNWGERRSAWPRMTCEVYHDSFSEDYSADLAEHTSCPEGIQWEVPGNRQEDTDAASVHLLPSQDHPSNMHTGDIEACLAEMTTNMSPTAVSAGLGPSTLEMEGIADTTADNTGAPSKPGRKVPEKIQCSFNGVYFHGDEIEVAYADTIGNGHVNNGYANINGTIKHRTENGNSDCETFTTKISGSEMAKSESSLKCTIPLTPQIKVTENKRVNNGDSCDINNPRSIALESAITRTSQCSSVDSGTVSDFSRHQGHFVVVAVDFGTAFSGYAFSFTRDPENIHMMRKWEGGDRGVVNQKTPTTILLTPEGKFQSFGFAARDDYHDLDPQDAKKWYYFEKFKMILHYNSELSKDTMLIASNGKSFPALTVFSMALRFFKDHALQELSDQSATKILNEDLRWVITVPAIWKAPAKQFMRQAAYEAGLVAPEFPDQLLIALEPEAASVYCRKLRMYQLVPEKPIHRPLQSPNRTTPELLDMNQACEETEDICPTPPDMFDTVGSKMQGTRYMVVDCGGGTVDITVHAINERGTLTELYKATGGPYGAVGVDLAFEKLLCCIFGCEFIEQFKVKRPAGWVDLMIEFESRKRSASPYKSSALNVALPFSFINCYKKYKGTSVENTLKKHGDKDVCWSSQGMLRLSPDAMRQLFQPTVDNIKRCIGDVLNNPSARGLQYLFLVGGFAESPILQYEIRQEFSHILKMIIPQGVGLSILRGAVLFGLDPSVVSMRCSRLTYGVGVLNRYDSEKHPPEKRIKKDGEDWCTDVLDKFVVVDQPIELGETVVRSYTPARSCQRASVINIYCTERADVEFVSDPSVRKCGTLCLDLGDSDESDPQRREIQTRMVFGDTEIKVSALDVAAGKCVRASIDFLK